jgi:putative cell wall-binding protein
MVKKVAQRAIAAGLAGMMSLGTALPAAMALDSVWVDSSVTWWNITNVNGDDDLDYFKRIAGSDRYETMKKIVEATYKLSGDNWFSATTAVVASGDNFPDALAANGLAGALNGGDGAPVILTNKGKLNSHAKELLKNLQVQTVYIMGGTAAISQEVEDAIRDMHIATIRVAGADRQATSIEAFNLIDGNWYKKHGTHSVIIASGANYADALSISPFAYATGTPIVLTKADGTLTDEEIKAIKKNDEIWQVIVVGGTEAVSDSVFGALGTYNGSYRDYYNKVYIPVRIAGADRYDTSAKIADWECNFAINTGTDTKTVVTSTVSGYNFLTIDTSVPVWADFDFQEVFIATGENFPDALAGGQIAGGKYYAKGKKLNQRSHAPILLTKDGNRAADAMIAQHLAWNPTVKSVNSAVYANFVDYFNEIYNKKYGTTWIDVLEDWIKQYNDGFATMAQIGTGFNTGTYTGIGVDAGYGRAAFNALPAAGLEAFAINYQGRVKDNNFHGVILGGRNAVSKDKAEQLDDTVEDTILKWYDADAYDTYHLWFDGTMNTWKIINNKSYNANMWSTQVLNGVYPGAGYFNNDMIVWPTFNNFNFVYIPTSVQQDVENRYSNPQNTNLARRTYKINFSGFNTTFGYVEDVALYLTIDGNDNLVAADFLPAVTTTGAQCNYYLHTTPAGVADHYGVNPQ